MAAIRPRGSRANDSWTSGRALRGVYAPAAAATGTYQAADADVNLLHVLTCADALLIEGGTGVSVSATSKTRWPADVPYYFRPITGRESLGWSAVSGTSAPTVAVAE